MTQEHTIAEITRRLVEYYHPERIYLFGSTARCDGGPDSDFDFCVVLPDDAPPSLYLPGVHRALWDLGTAVDVVRWPASDFDRRAAHVKASLPATITREGKVLYDTRRIAA
jgi:predicted nucleotidyltransferase